LEKNPQSVYGVETNLQRIEDGDDDELVIFLGEAYSGVVADRKRLKFSLKKVASVMWSSKEAYPWIAILLKTARFS
jgi:hypothetical protein